MIKKDFAQLPRFILRNIHVLIVICLALIAFLYSKDKSCAKLAILQQEYESLQALLDQEKVRAHKLELALKSESDPQYIEMMLKGKFGMQREDEIQVIFFKEQEGDL